MSQTLGQGCTYCSCLRIGSECLLQQQHPHPERGCHDAALELNPKELHLVADTVPAAGACQAAWWRWWAPGPLGAPAAQRSRGADEEPEGRQQQRPTQGPCRSWQQAAHAACLCGSRW